MKFKENDELYYVCPFYFSIEKVRVKIAVCEFNQIYYIDEVGAYLLESDLHVIFENAQKDAMEKLKKFYIKKMDEILNIDKNNLKINIE